GPPLPASRLRLLRGRLLRRPIARIPDELLAFLGAHLFPYVAQLLPLAAAAPEELLSISGSHALPALSHVVPPAANPLDEFLALFRSHVSPALSDAVLPMAARESRPTKAAEQNPGKHHQAERLPIRDGSDREDRRHERVPEAHDHPDHQGGENQKDGKHEEEQSGDALHSRSHNDQPFSLNSS